MEILLIGSGARESAMAWSLEKSGHTVVGAPGNAGMQLTAPNVRAGDFPAIKGIASDRASSLVLVGPEQPLVDGISDYLEEYDIPVCGPSKAAARTEGSKVWTKYLLAEAGVPSADFGVYQHESIRAACEPGGYIYGLGAENIVMKAEGLCGGKGVFLPRTLEEIPPACDALRASYKDAAARFVIEDRLSGYECSIIAMADGESLYFLPTTQDYKRRFDGNEGLNTGGMGAYTNALDPEIRHACETIVRKIFVCLRERKIPYRGFLYVGFMITEDGPMVLEINCRGGDPEMQVILACLSEDFDFGKYCLAMATGYLDRLPYPTKACEAVCVNLVDKNYPDSNKNDSLIKGTRQARELGTLVFHGATAKSELGPTTNKAGRVLSVVGRGKTVEEARALAYAGAQRIVDGTPDLDLRSDIALIT